MTPASSTAPNLLSPQGGPRRARLGALLSLFAMGGCQTAVGSRDDVPVEVGDSIAVERAQSYFRTGPAYRVSVAVDGQVRFESRHPQDSGRVEDARVHSRVAIGLLERAARFPFDSMPERLMGTRPYCSPVATDMPSVILAWYVSDGQKRIRDYLGCFVQNDLSEGQLVTRLRALENAVDSVSGVAQWTRTAR